MYSLAIFLPLLTLADKIPFYPASAHLLLQTQSTFAPTQKTTIHCPAYNITAESTDIKGDGEWTNVLKEVEVHNILSSLSRIVSEETMKTAEIAKKQKTNPEMIGKIGTDKRM